MFGWLGGLSSLMVGDDTSGHASSKRWMVLVSPNVSQELVQGRNLASGRGSIKRIEHPLPPTPLLQKRFFKSFPKKKKQMIFGFDVCWLGGLSSLVVGDDASACF